VATFTIPALPGRSNRRRSPARPILGDEQAERAAALAIEQTPAPVLSSLASWTTSERNQDRSGGGAGIACRRGCFTKWVRPGRLPQFRHAAELHRKLS
jgi:hypothetical protein